MPITCLLALSIKLRSSFFQRMIVARRLLSIWGRNRSVTLPSRFDQSSSVPAGTLPVACQVKIIWIISSQAWSTVSGSVSWSKLGSPSSSGMVSIAALQVKFQPRRIPTTLMRSNLRIRIALASSHQPYDIGF